MVGGKAVCYGPEQHDQLLLRGLGTSAAAVEGKAGFFPPRRLPLLLETTLQL